jgi:hypothetical protein
MQRAFEEDSDAESEVKRLSESELFLLRDIAGEAMDLLDKMQYRQAMVDNDAMGTPPEPLRVHIAELCDGEIGWLSVHYTPDGAQAALNRQAAEWGIDLQAIDDGEGEDGETYGLSVITVEP